MVRRVERFTGIAAQDWKFLFETAAGGSNQRLVIFLRWAERLWTLINPSAIIAAEGEVYITCGLRPRR